MVGATPAHGGGGGGDVKTGGGRMSGAAGGASALEPLDPEGRLSGGAVAAKTGSSNRCHQNAINTHDEVQPYPAAQDVNARLNGKIYVKLPVSKYYRERENVKTGKCQKMSKPESVRS